MKSTHYLTFIFLFVFNVSDLSAINFYLEGDALKVWAKGGLVIRDTASITGNKIGTIPYGSAIIVKESKFNRYGETSINLTKTTKSKPIQLNGKWVKIKYKEKEGFVFDGYLSKFTAPFVGDSNQHPEWMHGYLTRVFGVISKKEKSNEIGVIRETFFGSGASFLNIGTKSAYVKYTLPSFSEEEVLIFLKNSQMIEITLAPSEIKEFEEEGIKTYTFPSSERGIIRVTIIGSTVILETEHTC